MYSPIQTPPTVANTRDNVLSFFLNTGDISVGVGITDGSLVCTSECSTDR
jgi:hypothetical protein